jgi:hypothetical protein
MSRIFCWNQSFSRIPVRICNLCCDNDSAIVLDVDIICPLPQELILALDRPSSAGTSFSESCMDVFVASARMLMSLTGSKSFANSMGFFCTVYNGYANGIEVLANVPGSSVVVGVLFD